MALVMAAVRWHQLQLQQRPYLANTVTGVILMAVGDRLAQALEPPHAGTMHVPTAVEDGAGFSGPDDDAGSARGRGATALGAARQGVPSGSWSRTGILSSWSCIISPFWTWWYRMLARRYPGNVPRWVALTAALSVPFNAAFFSYSTAVEHVLLAPEPERSSPAALGAAVRAKLETRLLPTVATSLSVWVPVNYANFSFVPLHNRNLVASGFACAWNVFLSLQQHRGHGSRADSIAAAGSSGGGGRAAGGCRRPEAASAASSASSATGTADGQGK